MPPVRATNESFHALFARIRAKVQVSEASEFCLGALVVLLRSFFYNSAALRRDYRPASNTALREEATKQWKEAAEVTGRLVSTSNTQDWAAARDRFWVLYKGPLYSIESKEKERPPDGTSGLEAAVVKFDGLLGEAREKPEKLPLNNQDQASLTVARACKDTIGRL
jgi:hypothetical protein